MVRREALEAEKENDSLQNRDHHRALRVEVPARMP
jgi:hypothetical protein